MDSAEHSHSHTQRTAFGSAVKVEAMTQKLLHDKGHSLVLPLHKDGK